jgi:hypothetical protein
VRSKDRRSDTKRSKPHTQHTPIRYFVLTCTVPTPPYQQCACWIECVQARAHAAACMVVCNALWRTRYTCNQLDRVRIGGDPCLLLVSCCTCLPCCVRAVGVLTACLPRSELAWCLLGAYLLCSVLAWCLLALLCACLLYACLALLCACLLCACLAFPCLAVRLPCLCFALPCLGLALPCCVRACCVLALPLLCFCPSLLPFAFQFISISISP